MGCTSDVSIKYIYLSLKVYQFNYCKNSENSYILSLNCINLYSQKSSVIPLNIWSSRSYNVQLFIMHVWYVSTMYVMHLIWLKYYMYMYLHFHMPLRYFLLKDYILKLYSKQSPTVTCSDTFILAHAYLHFVMSLKMRISLLCKDV